MRQLIEEMKDNCEGDYNRCGEVTELVFMNLMDVDIKFCLSAFNEKMKTFSNTSSENVKMLAKG